MSALFSICDIFMEDDIQKEKIAGSTNLQPSCSYLKLLMHGKDQKCFLTEN